MSWPMLTPRVDGPARAAGLVALTVLIVGCGESETPDAPRLMGPQVRLTAVAGLDAWPALTEVPYLEAEYAVHLPATDADPQFAELVFALNGTAYEMPEMLLGEARADEDWIRVGFIQRLDVCPLGRRALSAADAEPRVTARLDGVPHVGEVGAFELVGDLQTGVARGAVRATLRPAAGDGEPITLDLGFEGVFQRRCVEWIYEPGRAASVTPTTGKLECGSVLTAIDDQPSPDPPVLPPWPIEIDDGRILYPDGRME